MKGENGEGEGSMQQRRRKRRRRKREILKKSLPPANGQEEATIVVRQGKCHNDEISPKEDITVATIIRRWRRSQPPYTEEKPYPLERKRDCSMFRVWVHDDEEWAGEGTLKVIEPKINVARLRLDLGYFELSRNLTHPIH